MKTVRLFFVVLALAFESAYSQIELGTTAEWNSASGSYYSTGGAFADINGDGWLDFVVSCGNDMARSHVMVFYFDTIAKGYHTSPDWQSADIDYHGHLSVADVNKDGHPDVAVSVYLGEKGFSSPGRMKLYMNLGKELEPMPSWTSRDNMYSFSCAFGDMNGDGYPDLAAATGESYNEKPDRVRVFMNNAGTLADTALWQCSDDGFAMDVHWADVNADGRLDLVCAYERSPNRIYLNHGKTLSTIPSWTSAGVSYGNSIASGDIDQDGRIDLVFTQNIQLGGDGKYQIYMNKGESYSTEPDFVSAHGSYYSGVAIADLTGDSQPELIIGTWGNPASGIKNAPLEVYANHSGSISTQADWTSSSKGISEMIVLADPEKKAVRTATQKLIKRESGGGVYYFDHYPIERVLSVSSKSASVSPIHYCYDRDNGWISLAGDAFATTDVDITYEYSNRLDVAYTNWNKNGNFLFHNNKAITSVLSEQNHTLRVSPCPAHDAITVTLGNDLVETIRYSIFNIDGAKISSGEAIPDADGQFVVQVGTLPSGAYSITIGHGDALDSCKFVINR